MVNCHHSLAHSIQYNFIGKNNLTTRWKTRIIVTVEALVTDTLESRQLY